MTVQNTLSENGYTSRLPKLRNAFQAQGKVLLLPGSGLVVVPVQYRHPGWRVVVVGGNTVYRPDGYELALSDEAIKTALEVFSEEQILEAAKTRMAEEGTPTFAQVNADPGSFPVIERPARKRFRSA